MFLRNTPRPHPRVLSAKFPILKIKSVKKEVIMWEDQENR